MRIFMSVDIDAVAGVTGWRLGRAGNAEYERARRPMTTKADPALRGLPDAGELAEGAERVAFGIPAFGEILRVANAAAIMARAMFGDDLAPRA